MEDELDEVYVCQSCGYEDDPDVFGKFCPSCGADLDELEAEMDKITKSLKTYSEKQPEPKVIYATVRESEDDCGDLIWDIECRFDDDKKYATVQVDGDCEQLAHEIATFLSDEKRSKVMCHKCGENEISYPHKCPYQMAVGECDVECTCCFDCETNCQMEI